MNTTENQQTLLQRLLLKTSNPDPVIRAYIETILPAMEREFAFTYAMGGNEADHYRRLVPRYGEELAREIARDRASKSDQSLLVHVLNALLIAWRLSQYLPKHLQLTEIEQKLLCLAITLHDYGKQLYDKNITSPRACDVPEIIEVCREMGKQLNFDAFWSEWEQYLPEIAYLAQNTQFSVGANAVPSNWVINGKNFTHDDRRLTLPLRRLLAFGDIAVHLSDPADIEKPKFGNEKRSSGDALQEHIRHLKIPKKLVYHRLRDCRGLVTNGIHNIMLHFTHQLDWEPILFFAQGAVYLAPIDSDPPNLEALQRFIWKEIKSVLKGKMAKGNIGFKRDGKGLKVAPQTLEIFSPIDLITTLPKVIEGTVRNESSPATPKRLEKLALSEAEKGLFKYADLRSDRLAEFLILAQREFFSHTEEYAPWILQTLGIENKMTPEQTQIQSGGVNYGWYHAAAHYMAQHPTFDYEQVTEALENIAEQLATWAEEKELLPEDPSPTQEIFFSYLKQYLEVSGWDSHLPAFEEELAAYTVTKTQNKPICSLSSGEFAAEDQLDSVVLFKPQQYSNKNSLGGRRIKRGISKIWSLEMLLRQARWSARGGKLEEQNPVFLYIFPAYVYSPETVKAARYLTEEMIEGADVNLWEVRKVCVTGKMQDLQNLNWGMRNEEETIESDKYSNRDLPFMATTYTKTRGKTVTDAWIKPTFLTLALPLLLGVKVVATPSPEPLYTSDQEFFETAKLDGVAGFWHLLGLDSSLRLQQIEPALQRLLTIYSLHLDNRSNPPDARWQALNGTVREVMTDVLNVFAIAQQGLRKHKREPSSQEVQDYWKFAHIFAQGQREMKEKLKLTNRLVSEYRSFYHVRISESSHAILLPLTKALDVILSVPEDWDDEELILQGAGQLQSALERQEVYKRPFIKDKSVPYEKRQEQELKAIQSFMTTCVQELFGKMCKRDRALLQENRNRIKSGAEFAYRLLVLQEKNDSTPE
ncbi:MAG: type I-D CRISPR-associated protein Cas10d/Csc3 [Halothece sp.]